MELTEHMEEISRIMEELNVIIIHTYWEGYIFVNYLANLAMKIKKMQVFNNFQ